MCLSHQVHHAAKSQHSCSQHRHTPDLQSLPEQQSSRQRESTRRLVIPGNTVTYHLTPPSRTKHAGTYRTHPEGTTDDPAHACQHNYILQQPEPPPAVHDDSSPLQTSPHGRRKNTPTQHPRASACSIRFFLFPCPCPCHCHCHCLSMVMALHRSCLSIV